MPSNLLLSANAPTSPNWGTGAGCTITANFAVAPDGTTTAFKLQDTDGSNVSTLGQQVTISPNTAQYVLSACVKKTSGATSFPALDFRFGGSSKLGAVIINTNLGTIVSRSGGWTPEYSGISSRDANYYLVYLGSANAGYTTIDVRLSPAMNGDASSSANPGSTGSAIFWTPTLALGIVPASNNTNAFFQLLR